MIEFERLGYCKEVQADGWGSLDKLNISDINRAIFRLRIISGRRHTLTVANLDFKQVTRRRRPHITTIDAILFVTSRLAESIPKAVVRSHRAKLNWLQSQIDQLRLNSPLKIEEELFTWRDRLDRLHREWFLKTEEILHRAQHGPIWMSVPAVAEKVSENLHRLDGDAYRLDAFSIMSNHVHIVFKPFISESEFLTLKHWDGLNQIEEHPGLAKIMHSLKGRAARECNLLLGRIGAFWEHESFDHVIRPGKFDKTIRYVLDNPVKAGLVEPWEDWRWNYCRNEIRDRFGKE